MTASVPVVALEILSASVWIGSLACLAVVAQAAREVLEAPAQVAFFRAVGRR
jgi:putative copper export protein